MLHVENIYLYHKFMVKVDKYSSPIQSIWERLFEFINRIQLAFCEEIPKVQR